MFSKVVWLVEVSDPTGFYLSFLFLPPKKQTPRRWVSLMYIYAASWHVPFAVYMYSVRPCLTPRRGSCPQSQRTTPTRSSGVSWRRWSPAACWAGSQRAAGRVWSGGRSSWSTCRTAGSWSASRPCACGSDGSARPTGRTSCRSRARYTRRGALLRKHAAPISAQVKLVIWLNVADRAMWSRPPMREAVARLMCNR